MPGGGGGGSGAASGSQDASGVSGADDVAAHQPCDGRRESNQVPPDASPAARAAAMSTSSSGKGAEVNVCGGAGSPPPAAEGEPTVLMEPQPCHPAAEATVNGLSKPHGTYCLHMVSCSCGLGALRAGPAVIKPQHVAAAVLPSRRSSAVFFPVSAMPTL